MVKILIVDDDLHIRELVKMYLEDEHFEVVERSNGLEVIEYLEANQADLIILDIMMPKMDGMATCKEIRKRFDIPILMITAKNQVYDRIKGFQLGTDDYLAKPFDPVEMVLRVKALLRRARVYMDQSLSMGSIQLNRKNYEIMYPNGETEILPYKEFELLFLFGSYPGQVFTREQLLEKIWGMDFAGTDRTVDVHIWKLRERLEPYHPEIKIVTLRGIGYRIEVQAD